MRRVICIVYRVTFFVVQQVPIWRMNSKRLLRTQNKFARLGCQGQTVEQGSLLSAVLAVSISYYCRNNLWAASVCPVKRVLSPCLWMLQNRLGGRSVVGKR